MNSKKPTAASTRKRETGQPVFGANVDEILTKKVIDHTKDSGSRNTAPNHPPLPFEKKPAPDEPTFIYRAPEQKRRRKTAGYGIAALVCLILLGAIPFLWSKLRNR